MASKDKKQYVCNNEYECALVGTLDYLEEMMADRGWNIADCEFYELGEKVIIGLAEKG